MCLGGGKVGMPLESQVISSIDGERNGRKGSRGYVIPWLEARWVYLGGLCAPGQRRLQSFKASTSILHVSIFGVHILYLRFQHLGTEASSITQMKHTEIRSQSTLRNTVWTMVRDSDVLVSTYTPKLKVETYCIWLQIQAGNIQQAMALINVNTIAFVGNCGKVEG